MAGVKLPTRPAPEPPKTKLQDKKGTLIKKPSNSGPFLEHFKLSRSQSTGKLGEIKKPPPRPPPPMTLLTRTNSNCVSSFSKQKTPRSEAFSKKQAANTDLLIDFNSPPSSPTLTVRSGSSPSSQIESGFEDDFDLFVLSNSTTPSFSDSLADDPFSPTKSLPPTIAPFELSNEDPRYKHKSFNTQLRSNHQSSITKPTIIRAKNNKPTRPPPPKLRPASTPPSFVGLPLDPLTEGWSPPMPNCPPPPPPPEVLTILERGPSLPPRPVSPLLNAEKKTPYCIALYDYEAGHPDDLSFKANDVLYLTERVNHEWLKGRLMDKEGMFPASYTKIVIPLESSSYEEFNKQVLAIYTFKPETWDDLPFQEGETILVTKRVNENWLYGKCNGRKGQFPATYVSDIPTYFSGTDDS